MVNVRDRIATSVQGLGAKLVIIGTLALLFLVPLTMVDSLLTERLERRDQALTAINKSWGKSQTLVGPMLVVPYLRESTTIQALVVDSRTGEVLCNDADSNPGCTSLIGTRGSRVEHKSTTMVQEETFMTPDAISIRGSLDVKELNRGIYHAPVYTTELVIEGSFSPPAHSALAKRTDLLWKDARLVLGIRDMRGIRETVSATWKGETHKLVQDITSGFLSVPVPVEREEAAPLAFSIPIRLSGSKSLQFVGVSADTAVTLSANWPHPNFSGDTLPSERKITDKGFDATWQLTNYVAKAQAGDRVWSTESSGLFEEYGSTSSGYDTSARSGTDSAFAYGEDPMSRFGPAFGVSLVEPIDSYRSVERAIKYGSLVVALVFLTVFVSEVVTRLRIHPVQYAMVGLALSLFFLCLLSTSEFVAFDLSYALSTALCTGLITLYCWAVLRGGMRALSIGSSLLSTYALLYVTLRAEDFSLLVGTGGLFVALGLLMYVTRRVDWYGAQPDIREGEETVA